MKHNPLPSLTIVPRSSRSILFLILGVAGVCATSSALAETQIKIDFSGKVSSSGGLAVYEPSPSEILDQDVSFRVVGGDAGNLLIENAGGPEGGGAMVVERTDFHARTGLFVDRSAKLPRSVEAVGGVQMVSGVTLEALVWIESFHPEAGSVTEILGQFGAGGIDPVLRFTGETKDAPDITLIIGIKGGTLTVTPPEPVVGAWHHIAGVVSVENDVVLMEIFLDGKSIGSKRVTRPENEANSAKISFVPYRGFAIGESVYTAENPDQPSRLFLGKIDAVAVTTDALDPAVFVLPIAQSR